MQTGEILPSSAAVIEDTALIASTLDNHAKHDRPLQLSLTKEMTVNGLSSLGRSEDGISFVFTKLDIAEKDVTDIDYLVNYRHIQHLMARSNRLHTLKPTLDHLSSLIKLDVSYNELTELLNFSAKVSLHEADFSFNRIKVLDDTHLRGFKYLKKLNIQGNSISDLRPIRFLENLSELDVSHNEISDISPDAISHLALTKLFMNNNRICSIKGIPSRHLEHLSLHDNCIGTLSEFAYLDHESGEMRTDFLQLRNLDVSNNEIEHISDVEFLVKMRMLRTLALHGNAFNCADQIEQCDESTYKKHVINILRQLSNLNGSEITAEQKIAAANMFGEDLPQRQEILQKYFG